MAKEAGTTSKSIFGWILCAVTLLAFTGVEFCYFLDDISVLKRDASLTWIVLSAGFLLFVTIDAFKFFFTISFWRDKDRFWYLTAFFLPVLSIYFDVGSVSWTAINNEGTQQMAQAMVLLHRDADFGVYRLVYFVGYAARQYILACLPTYFFGPSLLALRLGTSFIYVGSYLAFLAALANYFRVRGASNPLLLASFAGMMVSLGEYPLIQARQFEQANMPIGATLLFLAGIFNFLARPTPFRTFWVAWSFGFFAECYIPALGSWWLALFILLYLALHPKHKHRILLAPVFYGACCFLVACLLMNSLNLLKPRFALGPADFTASDWLWRYFLGYHDLLSAELSVIPCPLGLAAMVVLYFSFKFRDYRFPLVCLWCVGIAFASLTFIGSYFNLPQYDIHRATIILPPLAAGVVLFYHFHKPPADTSVLVHRAVVTCASVAMIYMVCTGIAVPLTIRTFVYAMNLTDYDEALYKIDCLNFDPKMEKMKKLYIVPPLDINDLETGLCYFSPSTVLIRGTPPPGEKEPGTYLLSYRIKYPEERAYSEIVPSRYPPPYLQLKPE
jgi:hypothetical protein